jgi:hypothetical protein
MWMLVHSQKLLAYTGRCSKPSASRRINSERIPDNKPKPDYDTTILLNPPRSQDKMQLWAGLGQSEFAETRKDEKVLLHSASLIACWRCMPERDHAL